ncbi:CopC domain-containing protein YobA [Enterobacteriaceae bacterium H20N1]|uniref:Copper resistance protein C n=1 Tax=Dryocola boscaweniae TaxID=2925397 RepID=A0A9X2W7C6_9ENTR|nr:CopC domain-containing protein YobA [Dryocola boscaweniae]MCT4702279.1 CopC domain-containing protein YobA [Dryocola boscaweniae]MCT4714336.1 CopC domain-containing protein YobA [Dryocola boscaweniae]MCT4719277.1 CopC domain-containing protein YobA [Dryocola boscaweniae]
MAFTLPRILTAAAFFTAIAVSPAVFAHAHLKTQYPAADAAVTAAPQALTLDFSEGIEPNFSGVKITGPQEAAVKTGAVKRNEKDNKQLIVPIEESLKPGEYLVDWHVVSVDGHKTKGTYHFAVK